jgi:rhodanese-related sulfurtransferase
MSLAYEVTPQEVKSRLAEGEPVVLIDVREPVEHAITAIAGAELVPMNTVPSRLAYLEGKAGAGTLVVFCHHGVRSLSVVHWLRQQGLEACQSMGGGIEAWSLTVDPSVPRY